MINYCSTKTIIQNLKTLTFFRFEEITTDTGAHVLAYGIHDVIKPGISLSEVVDEVSKQGGVSSAPHPFAFT